MAVGANKSVYVGEGGGGGGGGRVSEAHNTFGTVYESWSPSQTFHLFILPLFGTV